MANGALSGAYPLTKKLVSKPEIRQMDSETRDKFIDHFFNENVKQKAKETGLSDEEAEQFKNDIKREVALWEDTQGIDEAFNPVTGTLTAALTGGSSAALRGMGAKAAAKTAGYAGTAAVPTEYAAGLAAQPVYEKSPLLGMALEGTLGLGMGLTTERLTERALRKGASKVADVASGNYGKYAQETAERVSKAPSIFSDNAEDVTKQSQDLVESSVSQYSEQRISDIQGEIEDISKRYSEAETTQEKQQLKSELDQKVSELENLRQARYGGDRGAAQKAREQKEQQVKQQFEEVKGTKEVETDQPSQVGELEPGVTVRKDGRPYGSLNEVNKALKRKGMVETHEPKQLGENQWGFVAKTEKPTQMTGSKPAEIEQPEKLKFQPVKDWQQTSPGNFEYREIDEVVPEAAVARQTPLAHEFLNSQISGIKRKFNEGFSKTEVHSAMRNAYNLIKPGMPNSYRHLRVVKQLEDLDEVALRSAPKYGPEQAKRQIEQFVKSGSITRNEGNMMNRFMDSLSENPNFDVQPSRDPGSSYNALKNTVKLDSSTKFFHETGHWAFYNILSKEDRLAFAENLMRNYNSQSGWNSLIPARKKVKAGLTSLVNKGKVSPEYRAQVEEHFDQPLELFADMIGQHAWNNQVTAPEFRTIIDKANIAMKKWLNSIRDEGAEIPEDMKQFADKVFKAPKAQEYKPIRFEDNSQELSNHMFFIPKQEIEAGIERDPEANLFLDRILNENVNIEREMESSVVDVERVLDGLWSETMKWFHGVDVAYDSKDLTRMFDRLQQMYKPNNRKQMEDMLAKVVRTQKDTQGAGPVGRMYNRSVDAMTGGEAPPMTSGQRRNQAERIALEKDAERIATQQFYDASRQVLNDLHGLFEGLKARKMDEMLPAKMPRQQGYNKIMRDSENAGEKVDFDNMRLKGETKNRWLDDEDMSAEDHFKLTDKEHYRAAKANVFSRMAPMAISGMAGVEFDDPDGIPVPGTDVTISFDPHKWATRGFSIGIPFTNIESPEINFGPVSAAVAAGVTPRRVGRGVKDVVSKMYDETGRMFPVVRKHIEAQRQKAKVVKESNIVRSFLPDEGMPKDLAELSRKEKDERMSILRQAEKMSREINKNFSKEEQRIMADVIEKTNGEDLTNVNGDIVDQAEEVKMFHRQVRNLMREAGYPDEAINKLGDGYLHRIYSRHMRRQTGAKKSAEPEQLASSWKRIFGDYINPRGKAVTFKSGQPVFNDLNTATGGQVQKGDKVYDVGKGDERFYIHESQKGLLNQFKEEEINHQWEVDFADTSSRNGKITLRRDWTSLEREELGEVKEVVPRVMEFMKMASRDLALGNLFKRLNETNHVVDPKTLSKEEVQAYKNSGWELMSDSEAVKGTGVKKYGSVAGKLLSPDAAFTVKGASNYRIGSKLGGFGDKTFKGWKKLTTAWKLAKTAFNPGTHGRNFFGNMHICLYDGKNPFKTIKDGAYHIKQKSDLFQQAIDEGMLDSQFLRSELGLDSFIEEMRKSGGRTEMEQATNLFSRYIRGASKALRKTGRAPMRAYELGDEIFKMGYIADEVAKGKSVREALDLAQESFFDYRDIPRGIQAVRDTGLMPFVTYQYKIIPKIAKTAADNPHRLLGILLGYEMMNEMAYEAAYGEKAEETEKFHERMMPDWMKGEMFGMGPRRTIMLPGQTKDDKPVEFIDMMRSVPGGDLVSPNGLFGNYPFNFHPLASTIYTMATERKPMFDKKYKVQWEDAKTDQQKSQFWWERAKVVGRTWLPNVPFYPGSWSLENLGNAAVSEVKQHMDEGPTKEEILEAAGKAGFSGVDYHGTPSNLPEELVGFFGLGRIRRLYPEEEYKRSIQKLKREVSSKKSELTGAAKDPRTTEAEMRTMKEGVKSLADRNKEIVRKLRKLRRNATKKNR